MTLDMDMAYVITVARFRIGIERLWVDSVTGQHFLEIRNRTYHSVQPIPAGAALRYEKALNDQRRADTHIAKRSAERRQARPELPRNHLELREMARYRTPARDGNAAVPQMEFDFQDRALKGD